MYDQRPDQHLQALAPFDKPLDQQPHGLSGRLIVVDGVDGSGKSTLARAVSQHLQDQGHRSQVIDLLSPWVRQHPQFLLLVNDLDAVVSKQVDIGGLCAICLGDRLATWRTKARALVANGTWLVVDRYQLTPMTDLHVLGSDPDDRRTAHSLLSQLPRPDLTLLADCPAPLAVARVRDRPDERDKIQRIELVERLVAAFRCYAQINDAIPIDTSESIETALRQAIPHLTKLPA